MPESGSNIEERLKAYAERRRRDAGRPAEMHPAVRRLLQGEARRIWGNPGAAPGGDKTVWRALWPRLAFAAGVCAMFVLLLMAVESGKHSRDIGEMAADSRAADKLSPVPPADAPAPATPPPMSLEETPAEKTPALVADGFYASEDIATPAPAVGQTVVTRSAKAVPASSVPAREPAAKDGLDRDSAVPASARAAPAETTPRGVIMARTEELAVLSAVPPAGGKGAGLDGRRDAAQQAAVNRLYFVQEDTRGRYRENLLSPPVPRVLDTFTLSLEGDRAEIVDADGSTYQGRLEGVAGETLLSFDFSRHEGGGTPGRFPFEVRGTNQSSGKTAVVRGWLTWNAVPASEAKQAAPPMRAKAAASKAEIRADGKRGGASVEAVVILGGSDEIPIRASEAPAP